MNLSKTPCVNKNIESNTKGVRNETKRIKILLIKNFTSFLSIIARISIKIKQAINVNTPACLIIKAAPSIRPDTKYKTFILFLYAKPRNNIPAISKTAKKTSQLPVCPPIAGDTQKRAYKIGRRKDSLISSSSKNLPIRYIKNAESRFANKTAIWILRKDFPNREKTKINIRLIPGGLLFQVEAYQPRPFIISIVL